MSTASGLTWLVVRDQGLEIQSFDSPEVAERYAVAVDGVRYAPYAVDHPRAPGYMRVSYFNV